MLEKHLWRLRYLPSIVLSLFLRISNNSTPNLAFVFPAYVKGWVLEGLCKDIAQCYEGDTRFIENGAERIEGETLFYPHYLVYRENLIKHPSVHKAKALVWYTHPKNALRDEEAVFCLAKAHRIITTCTHHEDLLRSHGLKNVKTILGAADPVLFLPHDRGEGKIGFCGAYYKRKCPEKILDLVRAMPEKEFVLLGRKWNDWARFGELLDQRNFKYIEASYSDYPEFYNSIDVFVSTSSLEGGPISLLEAMMANVVPVVSNTGFAADLIDHGINGYIYESTDDVSKIVDLVYLALSNKNNTRETVEHLDWKRMAFEILKLAH